MTSIADGSVIIQTSAEFVPSPPSWFGEVVLMAAHLRQHGVLSEISEGVRFARRRGVCYEVIDFLVVLFGYAGSSERTLEAFYERLQPFAVPFMALFERDQLPARSTLSRFFSMISRAVRSRPTPPVQTASKPGAWWIERARHGWSLTSMARVRQPANVPCPRVKNCPQLFAG